MRKHEEALGAFSLLLGTGVGGLLMFDNVFVWFLPKLVLADDRSQLPVPANRLGPR